MASEAAGFAAAVGSALLNGSWPAIIKSKRVSEAGLLWSHLNFAFMVGFVVVGVVVLSVVGFVWTSWGLLSGALLTAASSLTLGVAIPNAGVALPSGIAAAFYLMTAYVWSAYILDQGMRSVALSLVGILVVIVGLCLVVLASSVSAKELAEEATASLLKEGGAAAAARRPDRSLALGLLAAAAVGVVGGSNLVPEEYADADAQGISYIPSFALGALVWSAAVAFAMDRDVVGLATSPAFLPGVVSGAIYGASTCCYVIAVVRIDNYSVASTISQCSMLITGAWGILLYDELEGDPVRLATYATGAVIIVLGAAVVSYYGTND